ncbi:MAG: fibronectin type III domain-containing protein [Victivallales bacterium]
MISRSLRLTGGFLVFLMSMMVATYGFSQASPPPSITNSSWISMGTSTNGVVYAITNVITDPVSSHNVCYVGGDFTQIGGVSANNIARWDATTSTWSALGTGVNSAVKALAVDPVTGNLYVGGFFTSAGGIANTGCIARWAPATSTWSALGTGMPTLGFEIVNALAFDGANLYAAGLFADAGATADVNNIAKWNGAAWSALGTGTDDEVNALAYDSVSSILYAAGWFTQANGAAANYIAKCDVSGVPAWSALGTGMDGSVNALVFDGIFLYAGGFFTSADGVSANSIALWDDASTTWAPLGTGMYYQEVNSLAVDSSGYIYVGGTFTAAGIVSASNIAQWDNNLFTWHALGSGAKSTVRALAVDGATLYVGGNFTSVGGKASNYLAKCSINGSTVPPAPTSVVATAGDTQADVSFVVVDNAANPIISCTVTSTPGNISNTVTGLPTSINVAGLTNGTAYTFKVTATNSLGKGPASAASNSVKPATAPVVPGAPTMGKVTAGIGLATVAFTAPASTGGSPITSYIVTSVVPAGISFTRAGSATTPITVTGLTAGTAYTFAVQASNVAGAGPVSDTSLAVTPTAGVPGAPTIGTAVRGNTEATVSYLPPKNNGGKPITAYTAISTPGNITGFVTVSGVSAKPILVTGLLNGTAYTFKVKATNSEGDSPLSAASNKVTPCDVPGAPTIGTATAGNGQATVTFTAPASTGGGPITLYTVTSSAPVKTATGKKSPIIVTGLTNGTAYTFTVKASNAAGTGVASGATLAVTPKAKIADPTVTGATAPVVGATASAAIGATAEYNAALITWDPVPVGGIFAGGVEYKATFTLVPKAAYTLTGVAANFFKVAGATTTNLANSGAVTAKFPKTGITINSLAIAGVAAPVTAAVPKTVITASTQYTGKITWAPALESGKFAPNMAYTATITLTPKTGYTVVGVDADTFTVAGAVATNPADSGVITAVFPDTAIAPITLMGAITGTAKVGNVLTAGALTPSAATVDYQWQSFTTPGAIAVNIGANARTYTLVDADADKYIKVEATGTGNYSGTILSNPRGPILATLPGAPIIGVATPGDTEATVLFEKPITTGGRDITLYTAVSTPGGKIGTFNAISTTTSGAITVTGLTNGTSYTFKVKAKNAVGTGALSAASNAVTPVAP